MTRIFLLFSIVLFGSIALFAWMKADKKKETVYQYSEEPKEIVLSEIVEATNIENPSDSSPLFLTAKPQVQKTGQPPRANRIECLFSKNSEKLPIVETVLYRSQVDWLPGRPAWIADYAAHYKTSRHFIARSLNGKPEYKKQDIAIGDRFNVLRNDIDLSFYLVIDTSRLQMYFYAYNKEEDERILLKTYDVGIGRQDLDQPSGLLTPHGTYKLGDKIAIYEPGKYSWLNGEKKEMICTFGTRWIPFDAAVENCTAPAKGYGIHGLPWREDSTGKLTEARALIKQYDSDGCIRLCSEDIEEVFAIIITRPSFAIIVDDYYKAKIPGHEKLGVYNGS